MSAAIWSCSDCRSFWMNEMSSASSAPLIVASASFSGATNPSCTSAASFTLSDATAAESGARMRDGVTCAINSRTSVRRLLFATSSPMRANSDLIRSGMTASGRSASRSPCAIAFSSLRADAARPWTAAARAVSDAR